MVTTSDVGKSEIVPPPASRSVIHVRVLRRAHLDHPYRALLGVRKTVGDEGIESLAAPVLVNRLTAVLHKGDMIHSATIRRPH